MFPPARGPACLSDLRIDMWLAGDLLADGSALARAHLASCATCTARVEAIRAVREGTAPSVTAGLEGLRRAAADKRPPAASRWRVRLWTGAMATGALLLVVATGRHREHASVDGSTRIKGGAHLGFYVSHNGDLRRGGPGEFVNPGDRVRFTLTTQGPFHVAVIGVDAAGAVTVFYPADGQPPGALPAGRDVALPRATELDATLGPETITAFFCEAPVDLVAAQRALQLDPRQAPPPAGCQVDRVTWTKERPR
jgi:hypothetical protein